MPAPDLAELETFSYEVLETLHRGISEVLLRRANAMVERIGASHEDLLTAMRGIVDQLSPEEASRQDEIPSEEIAENIWTLVAGAENGTMTTTQLISVSLYSERETMDAVFGLTTLGRLAHREGLLHAHPGDVYRGEEVRPVRNNIVVNTPTNPNITQDIWQMIRDQIGGVTLGHLYSRNPYGPYGNSVIRDVVRQLQAAGRVSFRDNRFYAHVEEDDDTRRWVLSVVFASLEGGPTLEDLLTRRPLDNDSEREELRRVVEHLLATHELDVNEQGRLIKYAGPPEPPQSIPEPLSAAARLLAGSILDK